MKVNNTTPFNNNQLIVLKDQKWLDNQRIAGRIVSETLSMLEGHIRNRTFHSCLALNEVAEYYITQQGGIPTFKGYKGFPAGVCISINRELVHGIPKDHCFNDGDLVSFDLGVTYNGTIADSALTCIFGEPLESKHQQLIKATEEALLQGIRAIRPGKRLGCIGHAISKYAKSQGFSVVYNYGGHGICNAMDGTPMPHAAPFVSNKADQNEGVRLCVGMVLAIEPLLVCGSSNKTKTLDDGWTVVCEDICAHHEHSTYIHNDHVEIITWRDGSYYPRQIMFESN